MKTLAIFHSGGISGPLRTLLPRLRALAEDDEVRLLFPSDGTGTKLAAAELDVSVAGYTATVLPRSATAAVEAPIRAARELTALRRAIRSAEPDVVVVATAYLPLALLAARLERVPAVLYAAELLGARGGWEARLGAIALSRCARLSTRIVAASDEVARQFPPERVAVVLPGVAPSEPKPVELPGTRPRIAVVGALSAGRGQDVAVDAMPLVREKLPEASLLLAGEPHARAGDEEFADRLRARAGAGVHFLGAVEDIDSLLAAVDVVVVPNRVDEGFGRVAFEALAAGTPVVSTPLTAVARLLPGHVLVVAPGCPDLLADAVLRALDDPELAAGASDWVAENLDEEVLGGRFAEVVRAAEVPLEDRARVV